MPADFIKPVVENTLRILEKYTLAELQPMDREAITDFGKQFTGVVPNFPALWVMPVRTTFDPDAQQSRRQEHLLRITIAVSGAEPDELDVLAMDYCKAVDRALVAAELATPNEWQGLLVNGQVLRVFVVEHDYGPLFEVGKGLARYPEMTLLVETEEV
jgi:hypothetical protein